MWNSKRRAVGRHRSGDLDLHGSCRKMCMIQRERYLDQDRNTIAVRGPELRFRRRGRTHAALLKMINDQGGRKWPQDRLHLLR